MGKRGHSLGKEESTHLETALRDCGKEGLGRDLRDCGNQRCIQPTLPQQCRVVSINFTA